MLTATTIDELKEIPLFRQLTTDELRYLAQRLEERECKKDETVYKENEVQGVFYLVQKGAVEITKKTPSGHRQVIAMILTGQFFGELSFFEGRRHGARAQTTVESRLLMLYRSVYDEMEKERPPLVHKLLREIILTISTNLDTMNDSFLQMINYAFYGGKAGNIEMQGEEN
jgi:CRP/FNR family cyclic AMP-dependent transcriptional regulator